MILIGFAIVATLIVDLIAGPWLGGILSDKFWILWPIMALTMSVAALFAAVMQRLLGAVGTLVTVFMIILLAYLVLFGTILGILDWYRRPAPEVPDVTPETEVAAVAVSIPAGAAV